MPPSSSANALGPAVARNPSFWPEPREREGDTRLVFQMEERTQPQEGAFSCPTQQSAGDGWSDDEKGEEGWVLVPASRSLGPHGLPNQIVIQSPAPDRRTRQSPRSRTGARLLPPRAIAAHA